MVVTLNASNTTLTFTGYESDLPKGLPYKHIAQKQYMLKNVKATKLADGTVKLTGQEEVTMLLRTVRATEEKANVPFQEYKVTVKNRRYNQERQAQPHHHLPSHWYAHGRDLHLHWSKIIYAPHTCPSIVAPTTMQCA